MFESLVEKRERRIAQPVLSFAIHASLIGFAVGFGGRTLPEPAPPAGGISIQPWVMPVADEGRKRPQVGSKTESILPRPSCNCDEPAPGPLQVENGGLVAAPGPLVIHIDGGGGGIPATGPGPSGVPGVYQEEDLTDSPVALHFPQPVYPPALKSAGIQGAVRIQYVVDVNGHVEPGSIVVVSTDHPFMAESVRAALLEARFRPGRVRGSPVRTLVRQTVRFSLMSL